MTRPLPSNPARTRTAAARTVAAARAVLDSGTHLTDRQQTVLRARVDLPHASLAELAHRTEMTKDAYAGLLRRLITRAAAP